MTQPENPKPLAALEADIEAALDIGVSLSSAGYSETDPELAAGQQAWEAYREQVAAIERENALLRAFVGKLLATESNGVSLCNRIEYAGEFKEEMAMFAATMLSRVAGNEEVNE